MPALTLPLTFANSFWSADYRRGLETLFTKLEQGVNENEEIVTFIRARAAAELHIANYLANPAPTGQRGTGFDGDEGASLLMAFRGLQAESVAQGEIHRNISKELNSLVADPFEDWAKGHKSRVLATRNTVVEGWLRQYEQALFDVDKLKQQYLSKMRRADEAEDTAKFAPNSEVSDHYTSSPRLTPRDTRNPQRSASVSERIAQRFKELQRKAGPGLANAETIFEDKTAVSSPGSEAHSDEKPLPKVDKGKGRAIEETLASPTALSPPLPPAKLPVGPASPTPILLAGLALPPAAVSELMKRAAIELPLRSIRFPIIGEYKDCFTGEEFATWLVDNVPGFGNSLDRAEDAAKDLCERENVLRRVGEFGNAFENNEEAFYQFRPKAFNLENEPKAHHEIHITSPIANLNPIADNLVKRSNTLVNFVSKAINSNTHSEPFHIRARIEAEESDKLYRVSVRKLDRQRLVMEERIDETLKKLQKWETDRLQAVKTVLLQYQGTLANLPTALQQSIDRSSTLVASYQPESDLKALIERYRTGPFKPVAQVYESITHDEADVYFGIDLHKWSEGGWSSVRGGDEKDKIPEVLTAMLTALDRAYLKLPNDSEKRKAWIYEVPLAAIHHLREALNGIPPQQEIPLELFEKYDSPVIASTVKLWCLELDPPLGLWEGWDDIRRIYPSVGSSAKSDEVVSDKQHLQDLQVALLRLPKVNLLVLQALFSHLKTLIDFTKVEESNDVYVSKLALSMGRNILRPRAENEISIQDRHPTLLFIDLLKHFDEIIPPTIAKKKRESDRKTPIRKRTAPIDMRISRSRLSVVGNVDTREILESQMIAKNPSMRPLSRGPSPAPPPVPPIPQVVPVSQAPVAAETAVGETAPVPAVDPAPVIEPSPAPAPPAAIDATATVIATPAPEPPIEIPRPPSQLEQKKEDSLDFPPRPVFKEPPPEVDGLDMPPLPPMPRFAEPPVEVDTVASPTQSVESQRAISPPPVAQVTVQPATPRQGGIRRSSASSPARSRSPSINSQSNGANLARQGSAETSRLRGPRGVRGARPQSGNVAAMAANFSRNQGGLARSPNRNSYAGSNRPSSPVNPHDYEPRRRGGRAQASAFSRRTMASDAEDEVVDK